MTLEEIVFYVFATILVASATMVVTLRNPVFCALSLVLAFFTCAGLWIMLEAEFLALTLILVYVGAVMVLFLFVDQFGADKWPSPTPHPEGYSNTKEIGSVLYTEYLYAFEIAAVILVVAIIAAIALTLRRRKKYEFMKPEQQVNVRSKDRVRVVKMKRATNIERLT